MHFDKPIGQSYHDRDGARDGGMRGRTDHLLARLDLKMMHSLFSLGSCRVALSLEAQDFVSTSPRQHQTAALTGAGLDTVPSPLVDLSQV